jgi:DNA-binding ferritin-like protein
MSERAERLERTYLSTMNELLKTTHYKKNEIGTKTLAHFVRTLVDECPSMTLKTAKDLYEIAAELEQL